MLSCFHLIAERYGQRQTDRIAISISRISVLTRDKNYSFILAQLWKILSNFNNSFTVADRN